MCGLEDLVRQEKGAVALPSDFIADGMLDSFDMVTLVATLDKTYGISIQGTDIIPENFTNLQTIEALLRQCGAQV